MLYLLYNNRNTDSILSEEGLWNLVVPQNITALKKKKIFKRKNDPSDHSIEKKLKIFCDLRIMIPWGICFEE